MYQRLMRLFSKLQAPTQEAPAALQPTANQHAFQAALDVAHEISRENPQGLVDLVRLLGRPVQADCMTRVVFRPWPDLRAWPGTIMFPWTEPITADGHHWNKVVEYKQMPHQIELAKNIVLPWPGNHHQLAKALAHIGTGRRSSPWQQDLNHRVEFWEPIGLCWVESGNHSITSGIVKGEGTLTTTTTADITPLYSHLSFDGEHFIRSHDQQPLGQPAYLELGAIFEIGRLMLHYKVSA